MSPSFMIHNIHATVLSIPAATALSHEESPNIESFESGKDFPIPTFPESDIVTFAVPCVQN